MKQTIALTGCGILMVAALALTLLAFGPAGGVVLLVAWALFGFKL